MPEPGLISLDEETRASLYREFAQDLEDYIKRFKKERDRYVAMAEREEKEHEKNINS